MRTARVSRAMAPRAYQARATERWRRSGRGVIVLPTGAGKTVAGCQVIADTPARALVLAHTRELVAQWVDTLRRALPSVSVGEGDGDERVIVRTVQGLASWRAPRLRTFGRRFGLLVVDEAHHAAAATWRSVIEGLGISRRLGLTATLEREDGLHSDVIRLLGEPIEEVSTQQLEREGAILAPEVRYLPTHWTPPPGEDPRAALAACPVRNDVVAGLAAREARGRTVLVLVERVDHVEGLIWLLTRRHRVRAAALHGEMTPTSRAEVLERARAGKLDVVVTTSLADEGLDVRCLDTVILAVPCGVAARTQQRIGRVLRPSTNKRSARVWDLVDSHAPWIAAAEARDRLYQQRGWRIVLKEAA